MYCLSISSLCISVNVLSTRQSDETHLNNFPKDFKLPTFFSPFQRKCANLLRRHWSLYWQNGKRIILQEIVVFQIKMTKTRTTRVVSRQKCCCGIKDEFLFFFFFNFHIFPFQSRLLYSAILKFSNLDAGCHPLKQVFFWRTPPHLLLLF